jgi:hypothetical protein
MVGRNRDGVLSRSRSVLITLLCFAILLPLSLEASQKRHTSKPRDKASAKERLQAEKPILGNKKSRIYHRPDCPNYNEIAEKNKVEFRSVIEAEAAGYRLAKNCP